MTINGTPVNFTFQSAAGIVITGISGILLQSASYSPKTKRSLVMDGNGSRTTSLHADQIVSAKLKWKVSGTSLANAISNTTLLSPGAFVTITACQTMPDLVSSSHYEVIDTELSGTNEDVEEISMDIELAAGIQSVAAA
jgi:hypothetical protein